MYVRFVGIQAGFSLVEMVVSLALASALFAFGVPGLTSVLTNIRLRSAMNAVCDGLKLARAEAIRRNGRVVICKSNDGLQCSAAGDWSQGWIIFHDTNSCRLVDSNEKVLFREEKIGSSLRISGNQPISKDISYSYTGEAVLPGGGFQAGTFTVALNTASNLTVYCIAVNKRGTHRVYKSETGVCSSD